MRSLEHFLSSAEACEDEMVATMMGMIRIPAIAPENGGSGEGKKADYLMGRLEGFDEVRRIDVPDITDPSVMRPNILAKKAGPKRGTVWIVAHMDVVPAAELDSWDTPPFEPVLKDGRIYGRGTEDNGQAVVSSIYAARQFLSEDLQGMSLGVALVADEETTSEMGIAHLLREGCFSEEDVIIVPDWASPKGSRVWVAEKGLLWLRFDVTGKSVHGSTPHKGINALRVSARFMTDLVGTLEKEFPEEDPMFSPPFSTFEPTKASATVDNVNTVPGAHSFCLDIRLLPSADMDRVIDVSKEVANRHSEESGARITVIEIQRNVSGKPSSVSSKGFHALSKAVEEVVGNVPVASGTGAATCANFFRLAGLDAYGWQHGGGTLHGPNEHVVLKNLMTDCKVFTALYYDLCLKGRVTRTSGRSSNRC